MLPDIFKLKGRYKIEHFSKSGEKKGEYFLDNGVTTVGKNHILDVEFHAATQVTTWYIGLIDNSGYSALADGDTMSSHAGWNEFTTYDESTRQEWTEGAASSGSITNSTPVTFTISGSGTIKGLFVVSNSTKSGTTGTLWATGTFASTVPVVDNDVFKVTYTVSC